MTYHMHGFQDWTPNDETTEELVDALVTCIEHNKWAGGYAPPCFVILSVADRFVINIAGMLDYCTKKKLVLNETFVKEYVHKGLPASEEGEMIAKIIDLIRRVTQKMGLWEVNLKEKQKNDDVARLHEVT